jgi:hypothetical protein
VLNKYRIAIFNVVISDDTVPPSWFHTALLKWLLLNVSGSHFSCLRDPILELIPGESFFAFHIEHVLIRLCRPFREWPWLDYKMVPKGHTGYCPKWRLAHDLKSIA